MEYKILSESFTLVMVFSSDGAAGAVSRSNLTRNQHTNTAVANDRWQSHVTKK